MKFGILTFLVLPIFFSACGRDISYSKLKEEWNRANNPLNFLPRGFEREFSKLPTSATLKQVPWSDSYWPTTSAGLAQRWNDTQISGEDNFKYNAYSFRKIKSMSEAQLAQLSPAEKFDILTDNYQYPLWSSERGRTSPDAQGWEGLCHGWASAALNFDEPKSVLVENTQGIKIPFGAADVKGLLDIYSGNYSNSRTYFVAERCDIDFSKDPTAENNPECRDTNAGTFHLVLTNKIGIEKKGFVADVVRDFQVWNHPVYSYETKVVKEHESASRGAAPGTVREVTIKTTMGYVAETGTEWNAGVVYDTYREYSYRLELDRDGKIIGGAWLEDSRPDFLWMQEPPKFYDVAGIRFTLLDWLYKESMKSPGIPNPVQN